MRGRATSGGALVCFVGIDGAGKSTLAKALVAKAEEHSIACTYVWGGFNSSFTIFRPLVAAMKRSMFRGNKHMEESRTKGRVLQSPVLSTIYQYLALTDYMIQGLVRIRLPLAFGANVVCDRYIHDLTTSIGVLLDYYPHRTLALLDRCLRVLPKPDQIFLIDLPAALAYQRKDDIPSPGFLSVRRHVYLKMANKHRMTVLDGRRDKADLEQTVVATVLPLMMGDA
jgi:thymidylate kinase